MIKSFTVSAIIGLALAGLVFVSQNALLPGLENETAQNNSQNQSENLNNLVTGKPFVESLPSKNSNNQANLEKNLTENFTQSLAKKIAQSNPTGTQILDGKQTIAVPDPDQIATDLLTEAYQKLNPKELIPKINNQDIKIIKDDLEALTIYAKYFDEIDAATKLPEVKNSEELQAKIPDLVVTYKNAVATLYQLPVPELFADIHKIKIAYLSAQLKLLEKMRDVQQDPVSTILASKNFAELEKEFGEKLIAQIRRIFEDIKSANKKL